MNSEKVLSNRPQSLLDRVFYNSKAFLGNLDWKLILLLGLPLVLIILNDSWLFSYVQRGYIDHWIYFGYFQDLEQHLNNFSGTYWGTRLPWILPGFLAYRLFSPLVAAYVLHLTFYYAAVISLYLILKQTIGGRTALLTAILMGFHYFFLEAIGEDYVDGAGLTYLLLTLLMLTNITRGQFSRLWLCLAGVFYGCLIYTQMFMVIYTPLIALYYLFISREHKQLSLKRSIRLFVFGFIGLTIVLCSINYCLNGRFFFFFPSIRFIGGFAWKGINPDWLPISLWWKNAIWLLSPLVIFFGSMLILIFHHITRSLPNHRFLLFFQVYFILNVLIHVVVENAHLHVLGLPFYASYMLPAMFLALGSQLAIVINKLNRQQFYFLIGTVIVVSLLMYSFPLSSHWVGRFNIHLALLPILLGIAGVAGIIIQYRYCKEIAALLMVFSFMLVNISGTRFWLSSTYDPAFQKHYFLTVVESMKVAKSMDFQRGSRFWYNLELPMGYIFRAVASAHCFRVVSEKFPEMASKNVSYCPVLNDRVFILSNDENALEDANKSLAQIGLRGEFINEKMIQQGPVSYKITCIKVCNLDDPVSGLLIFNGKAKLSHKDSI